MSASLTDTMWDSVAAVPELRPDALSKTHCGDWKLLRKLGAGEFAQVQGCQRRGDSTIYACKHIDKSKLVCTSNIKRTLRRVHRVGTEITAMRSLHHKSICALIDVIHSPLYVHVVMENGGRDLYEVIDDAAGACTSLATTVAHALACGVSHCQEHGIVHRDIKPENVLIKAARGNPEVVEAVKLCDFGLCAIAPPVAEEGDTLDTRVERSVSKLSLSPTPSSHAAGPRDTSPSTVLETAAGAARPVERKWMLSDFSGSPGFVAPEVVMHDSYNGRFIDAWSVGCVMLELVVGHDTFDHLWMKSYTHQAMCDQASFGARVMGTVKQLRQLPDFALAATPTTVRMAATVRTSSAPELSPMGDLLLSLLVVDPSERLLIQNVRYHPWLADVEAAERACEATEIKGKSSK